MPPKGCSAARRGVCPMCPACPRQGEGLSGCCADGPGWRPSLPACALQGVRLHAPERRAHASLLLHTDRDVHAARRASRPASRHAKRASGQHSHHAKRAYRFRESPPPRRRQRETHRANRDPRLHPEPRPLPRAPSSEPHPVHRCALPPRRLPNHNQPGATAGTRRPRGPSRQPHRTSGISLHSLTRPRIRLLCRLSTSHSEQPS